MNGSDVSSYNAVLYQQELNVVEDEQRFAIFGRVRPKLFVDGNQWCCLYGDDLQNGIVGFGESPFDAVMDWNGAWYKKLEHAKEGSDAKP